MKTKNIDSLKRIKQLNVQLGSIPPQAQSFKNTTFSSAQNQLDYQEIKPAFYGPNDKFRERVFEIVEKRKDLYSNLNYTEVSRQQLRYDSFKQLQHLVANMGFSYEEMKKNPNYLSKFVTGLSCFDPAVTTKFSVHAGLYMKTIMLLGTEKHEQFVKRAFTLEDIGSFCLTEFGHGSNVRNMLTTAHYDKSTQEFIINSPGDLSMKYWIGATANLANTTVVFAQLYIENEYHGLHVFIVPLRDKQTHQTLPGVVIGDCGPKVGNDGIDNGFLQFKNFRIPRDNLLDKFSQVSSTGQFTATISDNDKRFGMQLGALSGGRFWITQTVSNGMLMALVGTMRYTVIRKQFGEGEEESIIQYPLTQVRLIPLVATAFILCITSFKLNLEWDSQQDNLFDGKSQILAELHAISSTLKGIVSSTTHSSFQECRQLLGGHGYSLFSRLGVAMNDIDVQQTWEGDNNVLYQQTAKFLISVLQKKFQNKNVSIPSCQYISSIPATQNESPFKKDINEQQAKQNLTNISYLHLAIEQKANALLQLSGMKLQKNLKNHPSLFSSWNATQPFYLIDASRAYVDVYMSNVFKEWIKQIKNQNNIQFFSDLYTIWALKQLDRDYAILRDSNFLNSIHGTTIKDLIIEISGKIKDQCLDFLNCVAIPDFILGGPLAHSSGDFYNNYLQMVKGAKGVHERVTWWKQIHPEQH